MPRGYRATTVGASAAPDHPRRSPGIDPRRAACHGESVFGDRSLDLPDGAPGMAGALVACGAGATLAFEMGVDAGAAIVVGLGVAIVAVIAIKIGMDMRTARIVQAIAEAELEPDAAPDRIQRRLASRGHRRTLGRALRKIATDAGKWPWAGRLAAPAIVPHLEPETCRRLFHLAEVIEGPADIDLRGVAMVEDLVTNPSSPLFGSADDEIEVAVRRVLFALGSE
jgi:hypothetical protein